MAEKEKNVHEGHRKRLKERFLSEGLDGFNEINVVEFLLFYALPRGDTNVLAHQLLDRFGSLSNLFEAPFEEIAAVKGVGEHSAILIKMIPDLFRRYMADKEKDIKVINSSDDAVRYIKPYYIAAGNEIVYLLNLDMTGRVISHVKIFEGSVTNASVSVRKVTEAALISKAVKVVLFHNHPGGFALPSGDDIRMTKDLVKSLSILNIALMDHIVFADSDYVSMSDSGFLD